MMREMQLIMIVFFISMAYFSVTTASQPNPQTRYSVAKPLQASCLPKDGDIGQRTVSSVLQCQQFCTATHGCNTFAIGEVSGSTTCKMYSNIQPTSNCLEDGNWVGYSLTKTVETKLEVTEENICRTNDAIGFLFPRLSTNDFARIATASAADILSFTVAFWTKVTQQGSGGSALFMYQAHSSSACSDIEIKVNVIGLDITISNQRMSAFVSIPGDSHTHVAVTWSLSTRSLHLYLNGTIRITHSLQGTPVAIKSGGTTYLGLTYKRLTGDCVPNGSLTFNGKISQVYMWKKVLSATAIAAAMNSNAECQDLVFGWKDFSGKNYGMVRAVP